VLIEGEVYLFDPSLGLPIPAPNGVTRGAGGQLAVQPATLAQVAAEPKLLRRLDADPSHKYGVESSDLKHVAALLEASPDYLSRRMKLLESRLAGERKMVLTTAPTAHAERWKAAKHVADARPWRLPLETLDRRGRIAWPAVQARLRAMLPFYVIPSAPLYRGRVLYLRGKFVGEDGATAYFQAARPSNEQLQASSADPIEKVLRFQGKLDASYWLGLIAQDRGKYDAAVDYFTNRTRPPLISPDGPWTDGARYNLARAYEASGDVQKAILFYGNNDSSPGYHGDLLRAKWLAEQGKP
jgi:tetratricopeptide (TPR) repeat protein